MLSTSTAQVASLLDWVAEQRNAESVRIGKLIATLRTNKGWSQQDLANEIDMAVSTVSRWERGLHKGYAANAGKLAGALDVEVSLLRPIEPAFQTQLDQIQSDVSEIKQLLTGQGQAWQGVIEDFLRQALETASSTPTPDSDRPASSPVDSRRKPA